MASSSRQAKPDVITYGDHEIITPDTSKLRKLVHESAPGEPDPVVRAEEELAKISHEFISFMDNECERLDTARQHLKEAGINKKTRQALFLASHDLKGNAGTFGYPLAAPAAESLCRLIEHTPNSKKIPISLIDQHVDAVRAIVREYAREDIVQRSAELITRLRQVTEEFLLTANKSRPGYLKSVANRLVPAGDGF